MCVHVCKGMRTCVLCVWEGVDVYVYMSVLWHAYRGQNTICGSELSSCCRDQTQIIRLYLLALPVPFCQPNERMGRRREGEG